MDSDRYREAPVERLTHQPWFEYTEIFEDGRSYHGISAGKGVFYDVDSPACAYLTRNGATFSVIKNRNAKSLVAKVNSENLYYFLLQALPSDAVVHQVSCSYDLDVLLKNYGTLESLLREAEALPDSIYSSVGELGLFVRDFLLDVSIWNSFGLELLYELGILSASHWQDMQSWTAARSLDDLEDILSSKSETGNHEIDIDSTPGPNFCHLDTNKQLCYAAKAGNHHVVHGLLAFKEGPVDLSCLIAALNAGHFDIFWTLFNHGVIDEVQHDMSELIRTAARCGHLATVRALVQRAHRDRTFQGYQGFPWNEIFLNQFAPGTFMFALEEAAGAGHIEIVNYFLSLGEDINGSFAGISPLTSAAKNGHLAMVQHLVKIGAKPDDGALVAAVEKHDTSMAKYLLEHGANANSFERSYWKMGRPALTIAIIENDYRMFQLLLKHGANVNAGDCLHRRPIFAAVQRNNIKFTMPLLLQGATITKSEQLERMKCAGPEFQHPKRNCGGGIGGTLEWDFGYGFGCDIICCFSHSIELETNSQMEEPWRCPIIAEIRAKERRAMKKRLRESFLRSHSKFLDESRRPDASDALAVFANGISPPQSAWKSGISSIRRLLNSRLPSTLLEVFSSIQVSCAMRCAFEGTESPNIFHGKTNISADLDRWRLVVPADEQPLFDEIASALWDESYQTASHQVDWRYEQEPLEYFQKLMTSLITATQTSYMAGDGFDLGGERLNTIQERFAILNQVPCESHDMASLSTIPSFEEHDGLRSKQVPLLDKWKPASSIVILLTATAFFMVVIAFLSVLRNTDKVSICLRSITSCATPGSLLGYCHILVIYLGLSSKGVSESKREEMNQLGRSSESPSVGSTTGSSAARRSEFAGDGCFSCPSPASGASIRDKDVWGHHSPQETPSSTADSTSSKKMSRLQCARCLSTFSTVSNVNKHMKTDCKYGKKIQFPCRNEGCKNKLTRGSYRIIHEKERCPFRIHA